LPSEHVEELSLPARSLPRGRASLPFAGDDGAAPAARRSTRVTSKPAAFDHSAYLAQARHDAGISNDDESHALTADLRGQEEQEEQEEKIDSSSQGRAVSEPNTLAEAVNSAERDYWLAAVAAELDAHKVNGTWRPAPNKPDRKPAIPSRWVFKVKRGRQGEIVKFKARLVAKGYRQRKFIDYTESFAPTLRLTTLRFLLAAAAARDLVAHSMDVTTAFLVPVLKEEIYMMLPEQQLVSRHLPEFACNPLVRLYKTLYGLVQSPAMFFAHFSKVLTTIGFVQSKHDPCLWIQTQDGQLTAAIAIYVDDACIIAKPDHIVAIKDKLKTHFKMTDGGPISWFLSVRIQQDLQARTIKMDQQPTITDLLRVYNLTNARTVTTPLETRLSTPSGKPSTNDQRFMANKNYRSLVGSLMYLLFTRPDIAYAINQLTRHLNDPRPEHWRAAIRLLRYLKGTANLAITYDGNQSNLITGYSDADWAGDVETRRSTSGYVFLMCGAPISFKTKLQTGVALSTAEAELAALVEAVREAIWLRFLAVELMLPHSDRPITMFEDNQAALLIAENHRFSERVKHVAIKYFFLRHPSTREAVTYEYCPTTDMAADIMTKPLARIIFARMIKLLGLLLLDDVPATD
jgi:hypothetical protein